MKTIIYLVRHGETDWNKEGRFQGQKDIPLNHLGKLQAKKLGENLQGLGLSVHAIYASDLVRARETAEIIGSAIGFEVSTDRGLRERSFGILEGVNFEEFKVKYPKISLGNVDEHEQFQVEHSSSFRNRVYNAIVNISKKHKDESIIIVSHGAAINAFLHVISGGVYGPGKTRIMNTGLSTIVYNHKEESWHVQEVNNARHIEAI